MTSLADNFIPWHILYNIIDMLPNYVYYASFTEVRTLEKSNPDSLLMAIRNIYIWAWDNIKNYKGII